MANTQNITTVSEIQAVENSDKVFVNDNGTLKQVSVSNLMKQAPSGITEETDPTVPAWAKEPTKPTYTADEVGALPVGTKIPAKTSDLTNDSGYLTQIPEEYVTETELGQKGYITEDDIPEKLPSPGTLTFTGAVNDTYDGSADKTINIPTGGGEGGTSDYNALANKPKLNGVEIVGNKTSADYKIVSSEQGAENNGKFLGVGADGNVTPVDKPTYTANEVGARPNTWTPSAEDVGALPNDTEIPSKTSDLENDSGFITDTDIPKKLPNPQKIIFTGAVSAEYDGSTEQTVNIPSGGTVDPEQIEQAVNGYLEENPPSGMTAEEKAQLQKNTEDISQLSEEIGKQTGTGLSTEAIDKLEEVGNYLVYTTADGGSKWMELISILRNSSSGGGSGETVTLQSISATYTGGEVAVGTSLDSLTGITVTAHYSDGSTDTITGYALSGEIIEGKNTITVSYGGKTTTFAVTGVAESSGGEEVAVTDLNSANVKWYSDGGDTLLQQTAKARSYTGVFEEETEVQITVTVNETQYSSFYIGAYDGTDVATGYYAKNFGISGYPSAGEAYMTTYTVPSGYGVIVGGWSNKSSVIVKVVKIGV